MPKDDGEAISKSRLERLGQLSDEQFERMLDVAESGPMISRRAFITAMLGMGFSWTAIQGVLADASTSDSDGNIGTPSNRVDAFVQGGDLEELQNTQPSGTYTWQSIQWILEQGGVVASDGEVYQGSSAVQDAIDAVAVGGTVLVGSATYDPITIAKRDLSIHGVGIGSKIESTSADTHAVTVNDPAGQNLRRLRLSDLNLRTENTTGASDCLHVESVNGNVIYESWFTRLSLAGGPRHGINLVGTSSGNVTGFYADSIHAEGFNDTAVLANQYVNQSKISGDFAQAPDDYVFDIDGSQIILFAWDANHAGGTTTSQLRLGSNSNACFVMVADDAYATPVDNGTKNRYWFSNYQGGSGFAHGTVSNDGMTADPETATEDGFINYAIGGTLYQIPVYQR